METALPVIQAYYKIIIIKTKLSTHMNRPVQTSNELKTINRPNAYRNIVYDKGSIACQWKNNGLSINGGTTG